VRLKQNCRLQRWVLRCGRGSGDGSSSITCETKGTTRETAPCHSIGSCILIAVNQEHAFSVTVSIPCEINLFVLLETDCQAATSAHETHAPKYGASNGHKSVEQLAESRY